MAFLMLLSAFWQYLVGCFAVVAALFQLVMG